MSCSVAVASSSPVFSPSRVSSSLFCKTSSSPEASTSSPSSPSSPFRLRLHNKALTNLWSCKDNKESSSSAAVILKRKRPARLDIPVSSLSFAAPLGTSLMSADFVEDEGDGYAVYCKRGKRAVMEDRYSASLNLDGDSKQAFFGVFDGHGGVKAAEFAAENLVKHVSLEVMKRGEEEIEDAVMNGYLSTDLEFLKQENRGGSCCVTALIRQGHLVVSNAGDCRAVVSRGGVAEALTSDHRPSREDERDRIEASGGYVDNCNGVWRVQGSLAVSRGIGDRHLKQWVIAQPETKTLRIQPDHEFLILASDGLWDKVNNQEAVDMCSSFIRDQSETRTIALCKKLIDLAISRGSIDDITVMLIHLWCYV